MQPVIVYNQDVADVDDVNRISDFGETAFETLLESITQGKRSLLWGGVAPSIFSQAAPDITIRVPQQYYAIEARSALFPLTDILITHPSPSTDYDFYIYLNVRLADQSENRNNVDLGTFNQTPTSRVTHKLEETEYSVLNVASPGAQPFPATGVGVPAAGYERLGYVEIARFTWDGTAAVPVITFNSAAVVSLGSAGLPLHGGTHVTSDPIPHANDTNRGMMAKRAQKYLKETLTRVEPAAGAPFSIGALGANGPAGDYNYDVFNPSNAKGVSLSILFDGSLEVVGSALKVKYGSPTNGVGGSSLLAAREDHEHIVHGATQIYRTHVDAGLSTWSSGLSAPFFAPPTGYSVINSWGPGLAYAFMMVDMFSTGPDNGLPFQLEILGNGKTRWVTSRATGGQDEVGSSTMVLVQLDSSGQLFVRGHNLNSTSRYRISLVGIFGQG